MPSMFFQVYVPVRIIPLRRLKVRILNWPILHNSILIMQMQICTLKIRGFGKSSIINKNKDIRKWQKYTLSAVFAVCTYLVPRSSGPMGCRQSWLSLAAFNKSEEEAKTRAGFS